MVTRKWKILGGVYILLSFLYFGGVFIKTIIPPVLVGYEMIIEIRASCPFGHLSSHTQCAFMEWFLTTPVIQGPHGKNAVSIEGQFLWKVAASFGSNGALTGFIQHLKYWVMCFISPSAILWKIKKFLLKLKLFDFAALSEKTGMDFFPFIVNSRALCWILLFQWQYL